MKQHIRNVVPENPVSRPATQVDILFVPFRFVTCCYVAKGRCDWEVRQAVAGNPKGTIQGELTNQKETNTVRSGSQAGGAYQPATPKRIPIAKRMQERQGRKATLQVHSILHPGLLTVPQKLHSLHTRRNAAAFSYSASAYAISSCILT